MSSLEPGFHRLKKRTRDRFTGNEVPPAYAHATEDGRYRVVYPSGEVVDGQAAKILLSNDLLPVCRVEDVDREETPFAEDVEPLDE